ncbi:MAG: LysE family transporter [Candidatus Limnocylindrales bacterium]
MDLGIYLRGLAIGFAVALALGPVGLLVIRRTIDRGWRHGFVSGLGVATADGLYAAIAAFGLTALTSALVGLDRVLGIAGGLVLLVLASIGLHSVLGSRPTAAASGDRSLEAAAAGGLPAIDRPASFPGAWATMVGLTLTNPATILSFTALFASIGAGTGGTGGATLVTLGVASGSTAWWLLLTSLVAGLRARMTPLVVRRLNLAASLVIGAFGLGAIAAGLLAGQAAA